jgi:hypothetical protein
MAISPYPLVKTPSSSSRYNLVQDLRVMADDSEQHFRDVQTVLNTKLNISGGTPTFDSLTVRGASSIQGGLTVAGGLHISAGNLHLTTGSISAKGHGTFDGHLASYDYVVASRLGVPAQYTYIFSNSAGGGLIAQDNAEKQFYAPLNQPYWYSSHNIVVKPNAGTPAPAPVYDAQYALNIHALANQVIRVGNTGTVTIAGSATMALKIYHGFNSKPKALFAQAQGDTGTGQASLSLMTSVGDLSLDGTYYNVLVKNLNTSTAEKFFLAWMCVRYV